MVIYDLICEHNHVFEGWFKNKEEFDRQNDHSLVSCPVCESLSISLKVSAPNIGKKFRGHFAETVNEHVDHANSFDSHANPDEGGFSTGKSDKSSLNTKTNNAACNSKESKKENNASIRLSSRPEKLEVLREFVEKNFEDVGSDFSEEARRIHYGESSGRAIRGQASIDDIKSLEDEGISTLSIPSKIKKSDLN